MNEPKMFDVLPVSADTVVLPSYQPLPGFGVLPVNAFVIRAAEPVLVDTGLVALRTEFLAQLRSVIALESIRWVWLTHIDLDHIGNLDAILEAAPQARLVTTYLGLGKLTLRGPVDPSRIFLLNPGQSLEVGDRRLLAFKPATFDAPETTGLFDQKSEIMFSSDSFGAILSEPATSAAQLAPEALRDGVVTWATVDSPWLSFVDEASYGASLGRVRSLARKVVLSSHLPPATGLLDTLIAHLAAARTAPAFVGPDQAAFERLLSGAMAAE